MSLFASGSTGREASRSPQDAGCLGGTQRASGRHIAHQSPPTRLRGVVYRRPLLVTTGDQPKTAAYPNLWRCIGWPRMGGNHKVSLRRRVQSWESLGSGRGLSSRPIIGLPLDRCEDGNLFRPRREVGEPQSVAGRRVNAFCGQETKASIANKLSRGQFSAIFFVDTLRAIEIKKLDLDDI
jgi:Domain of unknown function (DUF6471)